jgi:hypothetical protein
MITTNIPDPAVKRAQKHSPGLARALQDHAGWVVSLFLVGLGAKLWLITRSGSSVPFADQWDAEAANLYIPFFEGRLTVADLFSGHGQHRILFTRLCNLGLLLWNGQWDNQLEAVFNALLHSLGIAGFGLLTARLTGKKFWPLLWIPLALTMVLPFAWENTLWGFQAHFYLLLFFSVLTIWLLGLSKTLSVRWWLGVGAAVAVLFTLASGFVAVVSVAILVTLDKLKENGSWRRQLPTLAVCAIIAGADIVSKPFFPKGYVFIAKSTGDLLGALSRNLAWPWISMPWFALCNIAPLALFGWIYLRSRERSRAEKMVFGLTVWVLLQALGFAYARGADGKPPVSRYMDVLSFIMVADCLCFFLMVSRRRGVSATLLWSGLVLWTAGCAAGLGRLTDRAVRVDIPDIELCQRLRLEAMRTFLVTDDAAHLQLAEDCNFIPIGEQARLLRNPSIRRILPAAVRDSLKVVREENGDQSFVRNGYALSEAEPPAEISWGSYAADGAKGRGQFQSLPVKKSSLPFLEIPVAGDLGEAGLSLELVDTASGQTTQVKPRHHAGGRWLNVYVKAPAGDFRVIARDKSETGWFAFKEPREIGRLSLWAMRLLAAWKTILAVGFGCLVLSVGLMIRAAGLSTTSSPSSFAIEFPP